MSTTESANTDNCHATPTAALQRSLVWRSGSGHTLVAHLECYPDEQLLRVRKQGGGTVLLVAMTPRELALARISTDGMRVVAGAKLNAAGLGGHGDGPPPLPSVRRSPAIPCQEGGGISCRNPP